MAHKTLHLYLQRKKLVQQNTSSHMEGVTGCLCSPSQHGDCHPNFTLLKAVGPATASGLSK